MKLLNYIFFFFLSFAMNAKAMIAIPDSPTATAVATGIGSAHSGPHTKKYYLVRTILSDHSNRKDTYGQIVAETNGDSFFNTADVTEIGNIVDEIIANPTRFRTEGRNLILEKDFTPVEVTALLPGHGRTHIGTTMTGSNTNKGRLVFQINRMGDATDFVHGGTITGYPY